MADFKIKIYADGADLNRMIEAYRTGFVSGFTTNPSLMKQAGVDDYISFAQKVIKEIPDLPISFEVFADDFEIMEMEAEKIHALGKMFMLKFRLPILAGSPQFR